MEVDIEWTRELFIAAQKFWRKKQPSFDDDFRGLVIALRKRKVARLQEQMAERQRLQKELLSRLKASTYTRVWNACLDASLSRGKLRPAFETWKEVVETMRPAEEKQEQQEEEKEANPVNEEAADIYAKILADSDAVARVDDSVLANLCKTSQLALMQGRAAGSETYRSVVAGRYSILKEESVRWPAIAATGSM